MNKDYPYMVVPLDETEAKKAHADGIKSSFHKTLESAKACCERQNLHSNVKWRIKETENEKCEWQILEEIGKLKRIV